MAPQEEQHVRDVLQFFFPNQSPPDTISEEVAALAAEVLHEALEASKAMDFVPRPTGFRPGPVGLISQAVQVTWRRAGRQRIYEAVRRTVELKYKTRYELAKAGL